MMHRPADMYNPEAISTKRMHLLKGVMCGFALGMATQNLLILRIYALFLGLLIFWSSYQSVCVYEWTMKDYLYDMGGRLMGLDFLNLPLTVLIMNQNNPFRFGVFSGCLIAQFFAQDIFCQKMFIPNR